MGRLEQDVVTEKVGGVYWFTFPLEAESVRVTKLSMPHYADALKKDVTDLFFKELKWRATSRQNLVVTIHAAQGKGKSWAGIFIAEKLAAFLGKEITSENINFTITDTLRAAETTEEGSILILDEQTHAVGPGSRAEKMLLENIEMVVRQHRLYLFFIAPRYVSHNYHYLIELWQPGSDKSFDPSKPFEQQWKYSRCIIFNDKQLPLGFIVTGSPVNKETLEKYEKRKSLFIHDIKQRKGFKRPAYLRQRAAGLLKSEKFIEDYMTASNKDTKKVLLDIHMDDESLTMSERSSIVSYIDFLIDHDAMLKQRSLALKPFKPLIRKKKKEKPTVYEKDD